MLGQTCLALRDMVRAERNISAAEAPDPLVGRYRLAVLQELSRLPRGVSTVDLLAEAARFPRPDDASRHEVETARDHVESYARLADLLAKARPELVHRISYEAMIANPEAARAGLLGFLGLSDAGFAQAPLLPDDRGVAAPYAALLAHG